MPHHDYAGMRQVTAATKQRICAGEVYQQLHEFRRLLEGRCSDYVMIDQDLGLTGFLKVAHMAEIHGCPVVNHPRPRSAVAGAGGGAQRADRRARPLGPAAVHRADARRGGASW
ncbi:MAG: enolase C-terminal domain-like protein [Sphingomonas sp.]